MKALLIFCFIFWISNISGCTSKLDIHPAYLPTAVVGKYYEQVVEIEKNNLVGEIIIDTNLLENSGIQFKKVGEDDYFYENSIKIYGTPRNVGKFYVVFRGYYRGGAGGSSVKFNKKYDFIINDK